MRRSREDALETRRRIVETAARLFRARGIARVSVADVVGHLRLTVGAFYRHFESKDALVAEAIEAASIESAAYQEGMASGEGVAARRAALVGGYLSKEHKDRPDRGCPVAALAAEIAHESLSSRKAFKRALDRLLCTLEEIVPGDAREDRQRRLRAAAALVGGLVLARATSDERLAGEILAAVRQSPELRS
jgi:TetR/AcrR family transcriptional regulator, transcriptional repressor for nem operon